MTPELLRPLESLLNRNIAGSARARGLLSQVAGRSIEFRLATTQLRLRIVADAAGISIRAADESVADAIVEGTPVSFARLALGDPAQPIRDRGAQLTGDAEIAQAFQRLFAAAQPDFEEELSRLTGDLVAHRLANLARDAFGFGRRVRDTLAENVAEYLTEESRDLPTRIETEEFLEAVDRIREATDRLDARVAVLERGRSSR